MIGGDVLAGLAVRRRTLTIVCLAMLIPAGAHAQSGIAGVVTDTTGAVLPGVTVEARSPALIEQVKSAVTDSQGQYRITAEQPCVSTTQDSRS